MQQSHKPAEKHHTSTKFYLENFTDNNKAGFIHVFDLKQKKQLPAQSVSSCGYINNYMEVEGDLNPDAMEQEIGNLEAQMAPVIKRIVSSEELPLEGSDDFFLLMNFIALLIVKSPAHRHSIINNYEAVFKLSSEIRISKDPRIEQEIKNGKITDPEEIKKFKDNMIEMLYNEEITHRFHNNYFLEKFVSTISEYVLLIEDRKWILFKSNNIKLITSDDPVTIVNTLPNDLQIPDYGVSNTTVIIPISKNIVLLGFKGVLPPLSNNSEYLAKKINTITSLHAHRNIYSSEADFTWKKDIITDGNSKDFLNSYDNTNKKYYEISTHRKYHDNVNQE